MHPVIYFRFEYSVSCCLTIKPSKRAQELHKAQVLLNQLYMDDLLLCQVKKAK